MGLIIGLETLVAMFVLVIVLDYVWLGIITKKFIIEQFGPLVKVKNGSIQIKLLVGVITWFILALGVFIFAVDPSDSLMQAIVRGAAFGGISYAIYDLTNLTFIVNYPIRFVFVDIAWGTVLCATVSLAGYYTKGLF